MNLNRIQRAALDAYANGNDADKIATNLPGLTVPEVLKLVRTAVRERVSGRNVDDWTDLARVEGSARMVQLAERAEQAVDRLRDAVVEHEKGAEVRARIAKLEAELTEARKQLPGKTRPAASAKTDRSDVRDWAQKKGIKVAPRGRIPEAVFRQYQEETS